jgi:probable rRNA maturation factor
MELLQINNLSKEKINEKKLRQLFNITWNTENAAPSAVSLAFVSSPQIKKINKIYRKKDKPTNVLSFSFADNSWPSQVSDQNIFGEIIISLEQVKKDARKASTSWEKELELVFVHGMLHLLGYDHIQVKDARIMEEKEKQILGNL